MRMMKSMKWSSRSEKFGREALPIFLGCIPESMTSLKLPSSTSVQLDPMSCD